MREFVLYRDRHACRLGVIGVCTITATVAHHVLGRAVTGDDPRYIVAACEPCNLHIGDPQTHDPECQRCTHNRVPRTEW